MKRVRYFVAALMLAIGVVSIATPASAAIAANCSNQWYVHAPYRDAGTSWAIWSRATCVPNGTSTPSPDVYLPGSDGIITIALWGSSDGGAHWAQLGINYMNGGTLVPWQNTSIATYGFCNTGWYYTTYIEWKYPNGTYGNLTTPARTLC